MERSKRKYTLCLVRKTTVQCLGDVGFRRLEINIKYISVSAGKKRLFICFSSRYLWCTFGFIWARNVFTKWINCLSVFHWRSCTVNFTVTKLTPENALVVSTRVLHFSAIHVLFVEMQEVEWNEWYFHTW